MDPGWGWLLTGVVADIRLRVTAAGAGVSAPWLFRLAVELIVGGILAGALSAALIVVPVRLASGVRRP